VTPTPAYLYYLFAVAMLAVAAYSVALLVVSVAYRRPSGWDVDIAHLAMGLSMAGMFITGWAFGRNAMWQLIFLVLLVWFVVRSIQAMQLFGLHLSHYLIHAAMSFAMLLMYWFPAQSGQGSSMSMSMGMASGGARIEPGLSFLLAFLFFGSAIFTLASPNKGASHHGTHHRALALSAAAGGIVEPEVAPAPLTGAAGVIATPWLEDAAHVVMCVGMGFMLILMI